MSLNNVFLVFGKINKTEGKSNSSFTQKFALTTLQSPFVRFKSLICLIPLEIECRIVIFEWNNAQKNITLALRLRKFTLLIPMEKFNIDIL